MPCLARSPEPSAGPHAVRGTAQPLPERACGAGDEAHPAIRVQSSGRIEYGGRSLVYSGDTGPCEALVDLA
ncbi:hypothetical protein ACWEWX_11360, partial [Streptomyces asiaticus]